MLGNVLVDSSFFIDRLRAGEDPFEEFEEYADDYDFLTCGVVMTEVLRGVKLRKAHDRFKGLFETMLYVPSTNSLWEGVMDLAWHLDRKGEFMQVTDLVIAVSAKGREASVLTFDSDFKRVPGLHVIDRLG